MLPVHNFYVFEFHNSRSDSVAHVKGIHVPFMIYYTVLRMCRLNGHALFLEGESSFCDIKFHGRSKIVWKIGDKS